MTECDLLQKILVEAMTTNALLGRLLVLGVILTSVSVAICWSSVTRR